MLDACSRIDDKTAARDNLYLLVERIRKVKVVNHRSRFLSIPTALHFASATPLSRNIARVCQWKESAAQIEQQFVFRADRRWFLRNRTLSVIIVIDGCLIIAAVFNQSPILFASLSLRSKKEFSLSLSLFFFLHDSLHDCEHLEIFGMLLDGSALLMFTEKKNARSKRYARGRIREEWKNETGNDRSCHL